MVEPETFAWGEVGSPVIPQALREALKRQPVPKSVQEMLGAEVTALDLHSGVWQKLPGQGVHVHPRRLCNVVTEEYGASLHLVLQLPAVPPDVTGAQLGRTRLRTRAYNVLMREGLLTDDDRLADLTVGDLWAFHACGVTTVLELMCVAEALSEAPSEPRPDPPDILKIRSTLGQLSAWALEERGASNLGELIDLLSEAPDELSWTVAELRRIELSSLSSHETRARFDVREQARRLWNRMDDRTKLILRRRWLDRERATLEELGKQLDVSRERVRQLEARLLDQLTEELPAPVARLSARTRSSLGAVLLDGPPPEEAEELVAVLRDAGAGSDAWALALLLAGPYSRRKKWWHREDSRDRLDELPNWLLEQCGDHGLIDAQEVHTELEQAGIMPRWHRRWLEDHVPLKRVGEMYVRWDGGVNDKLVRMLALRGEPVTTEELMGDAGLSHSVRGARQRLFEDPRAVRVDKGGRLALAEWGYEEYGGIVETMEEELKRRGEPLSLDDLSTSISGRFGVSPSSVRTYAGAPVFVTEHGMVRWRRADEPFELSTDLRGIQGMFDYGDRVVLRLSVNWDTQRGSGRQLHGRLAMRLGVPPGTRRGFANASGDVVISWPMHNFMPGLSSLRPHCNAQGADLGDHVVVILREDGVADVRRVPEAERGLRRRHLRRSVGLPTDTDEETLLGCLGHALGVGPRAELIQAALRERGEEDLAEALAG